MEGWLCIVIIASCTEDQSSIYKSRLFLCHRHHHHLDSETTIEMRWPPGLSKLPM